MARASPRIGARVSEDKTSRPRLNKASHGESRKASPTFAITMTRATLQLVRNVTATPQRAMSLVIT